MYPEKVQDSSSGKWHDIGSTCPGKGDLSNIPSVDWGGHRLHDAQSYPHLYLLLKYPLQGSFFFVCFLLALVLWLLYLVKFVATDFSPKTSL